MQPFNKLTFNSVPNSPAANDTARSNFSNRSSQVHLPRTKQEPCCLIYRCAMQEKDEFFVSSWVVEVQPGRAILEKPPSRPMRRSLLTFVRRRSAAATLLGRGPTGRTPHC